MYGLPLHIDVWILVLAAALQVRILSSGAKKPPGRLASANFSIFRKLRCPRMTVSILPTAPNTKAAAEGLKKNQNFIKKFNYKEITKNKSYNLNRCQLVDARTKSDERKRAVGGVSYVRCLTLQRRM